MCAEADQCGEGDNSDQSNDTAGPTVPPMHAEGACGGVSGKDVKVEEEEDAPVYETRHMADIIKVRSFLVFIFFM